MYLIDEPSYTSDYSYEKIDESRQHIVVYSGGCDSTLVLYEMAKKYGTKENPIIALSFNHHGPCPRKINQEKRVRKGFKKYCKINKLHVVFYDVTTTTTLKNHKHIKLSCSGIIQPYLWLGSLDIFLLDSENPKNILLGYIRHDDFWMFKSEFIDAFKAIQKIIMTNHKLYFPLMGVSKKYVIEKLQEYGIYDYTWYCETPTENHEKCGNCTPCKKHNATLEEIRKENECNKSGPVELGGQLNMTLVIQDSIKELHLNVTV